jgi:SAM-dependent methyltransferase
VGSVDQPGGAAAETTAVEELEADLVRYYDQEAESRANRDVDPERVRRRDEFAALLHSEGRSQVIEIGTGPGRDATALLAADLVVAGVDLSPEHVRLCRAAGIDAHVASVHRLPFADGSFDAGWTMSTLLHVPDADFDTAVREIRRVLRPGAPLAVGLWGGSDWEGRSVKDKIRPARFFSSRSDERIQVMLGRHGTVERFETWSTGRADSWWYQWCVLRVA